MNIVDICITIIVVMVTVFLMILFIGFLGAAIMSAIENLRDFIKDWRNK